MFFLFVRTHRFSKLFALTTLFALTLMLVIPPAVLAQTEEDDQQDKVFGEFQEAITLRGNGEYESAIEKLMEIIEEYTASDEVLRLAYHHLVWTYQEQDNMALARQSAHDALERFPDLSADKKLFPSFINGYYNELREEMFGSLMIPEPEGCRVFLDEELVGETPLDLRLVRVGEYDLTLTKSGYQDYTERIEIQPNLKSEKTVSLERKRGVMWWTYRVGAGVVAVGLLALTLSGGDDPSPEPDPEPLDEPPGPPTN